MGCAEDGVVEVLESRPHRLVDRDLAGPPPADPGAAAEGLAAEEEVAVHPALAADIGAGSPPAAQLTGA